MAGPLNMPAAFPAAIMAQIQRIEKLVTQLETTIQKPPSQKRDRQSTRQVFRNIEPEPPDRYQSNINVSNNFYYRGSNLPTFSGKEDYLKWEGELDAYFRRHQFPKKEQAPAALRALRGEALRWWKQEKQWQSTFGKRTYTWSELKRLLYEHYLPHQLPPKTCIKRTPKPLLKHATSQARKEQVTHQSVDVKTNKERPPRLKIQKPEHNHPLPSHKEIMVHTKNVKAKSIFQPSLESSCEKKQSQETTKEENQISMTTTLAASLELVEIKPWDCVSVSDNTKIELELYTSSQGNEFEQSGQQGAGMFSNLLCGTQVSLAYESIQYLNNIIFTHSIKQSVLDVEISSIIHLILSVSAKEDTGSLNDCNNLERNTAMRSLTMDQTEQPTQFVQEPVLLPILCEYTRKHCKEFDLVEKRSNLFVIVSTKDEKRFGLEKVKEFYVPNVVFDKMISSFEAFTPERISKQMGFLFNKSHEFSSSLKVSLCSDVFDMIRTKTENALFITWHELNCLYRKMLINPCMLNVKDHVLNLNYSLSKEFVSGTLERLFFYSYHTFDVFSIVFVKEKERQVKRPKTKNDQVLSNEVDYGSTQRMNFPMEFWSWKYLRKKISNFQGDCELLRLESTNQEHGRVFRVYLIFKDKPPDISLVFRTDYNFQHPNVHKGTMIVFRRTRRVQVWEENQRFKPPDLDKHEHNMSKFFCLIQAEPPDAEYNLKLSGRETSVHYIEENVLESAPFKMSTKEGECILDIIFKDKPPDHLQELPMFSTLEPSPYSWWCVEHIRSLFQGYTDTHDEPDYESTFNGFLIQLVIFLRLNQPKRVSELKVMKLTSWGSFFKPDYAIRMNIDQYRPTQLHFPPISTWRIFYGLLRFQQAMEHKKWPPDRQDMLHLPKGNEYVIFVGNIQNDYLEQLQTYVWRPGELAMHGDRPFKILVDVNDDDYHFELAGEFNLSSTFNVANLERFDADNDPVLRTKHFQEGGNDEDIRPNQPTTAIPEVPSGPMTRQRARALSYKFSNLVDYIMDLEGDDLELKHGKLGACSRDLLLSSKVPWALLKASTASLSVFTITKE